MVRRSITSALIFSFASSSAAPSATFIILLKETIVTSVPSLATFALPIGIIYSPSGTSPLSPYINSLSIKTTGSSSLMADLRSPFASYGLLTDITFMPGIFAYILSKEVECCAPSCPALPFAPLKTIGQPTCPPLIANILEAVFKI